MGVRFDSYRAFEEYALKDDDLAFVPTVDAFLASSDPTWHIDRHVWEPDLRNLPDPGIRGGSPFHAVCRLGAAVLGRWQAALESQRARGVFVSTPFLTLDDEWLGEVETAAPPHVYVCLARDHAAFDPVVHDARLVAHAGIDIVDALSSGRRLRRVDGERLGPGAWLLDALVQSRRDLAPQVTAR